MTPKVLTLDQVREQAPSVFANNPFPGLSGRYAFVPTAQIVEGLMSEGWMPTMATQSRVRVAEKAGYQKHLLRFARQEDITRVNEMVTRTDHVIQRNDPLARFIEIVLTNSHDGLASYELHGGFFELVCSNGLIIASASFGGMRVRHTGDPNGIITASYEILDNASKYKDVVREWQGKMLTPDQRLTFALQAARLRYDVAPGENLPIAFGHLLDSPHDQDFAHNDLWTTFNVIQENLMKGGQDIRRDRTVVAEDGSVRKVRKTATRSVRSVNANLKINKGLWNLAQNLAISVN